jgi:hypothetical protein
MAWVPVGIASGAVIIGVHVAATAPGSDGVVTAVVGVGCAFDGTATSIAFQV